MAEMLGVADGVDIQMGTFGKALGSYGVMMSFAGVAGSRRSTVRAVSSFLDLPAACCVGAPWAAVAPRPVAGKGRACGITCCSSLTNSETVCVLAGFTLSDGDTQIVPLMTGEA